MADLLRPPSPDDDDEGASAYLDGEASMEVSARIEADPALLARVEEMRAVRHALAVPAADPDPVTSAAAVRAVLAAFAAPLGSASDEAHDALAGVPDGSRPPSLPPGPAGPIGRPAHSRWRRPLAPLAAAAAAVALVVIGSVAVLADRERDEGIDAAAPPASTLTEAVRPSTLFSGESTRSDAAESAGAPMVPAPAATGSPPAGLGALPDDAALHRAVSAAFPVGVASSPSTTMAAGPAGPATAVSDVAAAEARCAPTTLPSGLRAVAVLAGRPVVAVLTTEGVVVVLDLSSCTLRVVQP